jgi:hypothetical protein
MNLSQSFRNLRLSITYIFRSGWCDSDLLFMIKLRSSGSWGYLCPHRRKADFKTPQFPEGPVMRTVRRWRAHYSACSTWPWSGTRKHSSHCPCRDIYQRPSLLRTRTWQQETMLLRDRPAKASRWRRKSDVWQMSQRRCKECFIIEKEPRENLISQTQPTRLGRG